MYYDNFAPQNLHSIKLTNNWNSSIIQMKRACRDLVVFFCFLVLPMLNLNAVILFCLGVRLLSLVSSFFSHS